MSPGSFGLSSEHFLKERMTWKWSLSSFAVLGCDRKDLREQCHCFMSARTYFFGLGKLGSTHTRRSKNFCLDCQLSIVCQQGHLRNCNFSLAWSATVEAAWLFLLASGQSQTRTSRAGTPDSWQFLEEDEGEVGALQGKKALVLTILPDCSLLNAST